MTRAFKVGDRVYCKDVRREGTVTAVQRSNYEGNYPIKVDFSIFTTSYTTEGQRLIGNDVVLTHVLVQENTTNNNLNLTLPTDSNERKEIPLMEGCLKYFPAALMGVAKLSKQGNDKHNPGEPLHHAREKSRDHGDCIIRHLLDTEEMRKQGASKEQVLTEVSSLAWRALAYAQEMHEKYGAPLAPNAKEGEK